MPNALRIAVTMRVTREQYYDEARDAISHDWTDYLQSLGYVPILVPSGLVDPLNYVRNLDASAIIVTGGNTAPSIASTSQATPRRDNTEFALIKAAESGLPVLGVCRGMQMINTYFGGKVTGNLAQTEHPVSDHVDVLHPLMLKEPSWKKLVQTDTMTVNSFHEDGVLIGDLARDLIATAVADDVVVEGLAHCTLPVVGIQWHPERQSPSSVFDRLLFETFLLGDLRSAS